MKKLSFILFFIFHCLYAQVEQVPVVPLTSNWTSAISYNLSGQTISKGVSFFNTLGKPTQNQSWDLLTNRVWASEIRYDYFGRPALQTLSAPLNNTATFGYRPDFIRSNNSPIAIHQYDSPTTLFNPPQISADQNTLGWYYSTQNNLDAYQDITVYPYSRVIYSDLNPGTSRAFIGGNKVMVNGQQTWLQTYSFTMPMEKHTQGSAFHNFFNGKKMLKTVSRGVDGVESVVFTDIEGNPIGAARSGLTDSGSQSQNAVYSQIFEKGYVDIHIPEGCGGTITISNLLPNAHRLRIFDLITENVVMSDIYVVGSQPQNFPVLINPGFYRIEDEKKHYLANPSSNPILISHKVNYYDLTHNTFDIANRLISSTQPLNGLFPEPNSLKSTFSYNSLGQLLFTNSPDEGVTKFKYRKDGQIRFSQNAEQAKENKYSYTNYDYLGRPVESGVYTALGSQAILFENTDAIVDLPDGLSQPYPVIKNERLFSVYDVPDDALNSKLSMCSLPEEEYKQTFLAGNVSYTYTSSPFTSKTWYSYDIYGRVVWMIQEIRGLPCLKTIDYEYDPINGQIAKVLYQKHSLNDQFIHRYTYNIAGQLTDVETSINNINFEKQAHYKYNESGALIRTEIAQNLQGIDYVYNLNGQLKAINHPSILPQNDPGNDGNNGFVGDVFGLALDYFSGDYTRTGTPKPVSAISGGNDQFNGNIKATRWNTQVPSTTQNAYTYNYNKNNWLTQASFGSVNASGVFTQNSNQDYKVSGITYDANGNIKTLQRNGYTDANGNNAMDNLTYNYEANKLSNRLKYVKDDNDNTDPLRYNDIKDQENNSVIGASVLKLPNYIYNDLGQLTINFQDKTIYEYNAAGLVTKIKTFDQQDNGDYVIIENQNFSDGISGKKDWISTGTGQGFNDIYFAENNECTALTNIYGNLLQLKGKGSRVKRMPVTPNTFYRFGMGVVIDRKLFQELDPSDPNYIAPSDDLIDAWAEVKIKDENGTVLATYTVNNQAVEFCDRFYDQYTYTTFTTGANDQSIHIELTIYNDQTSPFVVGTQRSFVDNILLEAAVNTKVAFQYNDRGQRVKKQSFSSIVTTTTFYVRDAAGNVMGVYSEAAGGTGNYRLKVEEHSIYGSNRIGVFKRQNTQSGGYGLYELTDHLGNVRAVIMKSGTNALSLTTKSDYYPFGMPMPNKHTTDGNYRYAFQGQEKDGETGMEAFELRLWDGRIGRWLTVDPYHEFFSPYVGMGNNPISLIDPDGGSTIGGGDDCVGCAAHLGGELSEVVLTGTSRLKNIEPAGFSWLNDKFLPHAAHSLLGFVNAWGSNNLLGAGRGNPEKFGKYEGSFRVGALIGDLYSISTGMGEMMMGGGAMLGGVAFAIPSGGATTVLSAGGAVVAAHGTSVVFNGVVNSTAGIKGLVNYYSQNNHGSSGSSGGGGFNFKKISDDLLKSLGLDAHAIKMEFLGKKAPIAQYDLYVNNGTKEIYIFKKGGKGEGIATGYFID